MGFFFKNEPSLTRICQLVLYCIIVTSYYPCMYTRAPYFHISIYAEKQVRDGGEQMVDTNPDCSLLPHSHHEVMVCQEGDMFPPPHPPPPSPDIITTFILLLLLLILSLLSSPSSFSWYYHYFHPPPPSPDIITTLIPLLLLLILSLLSTSSSTRQTEH